MRHNYTRYLKPTLLILLVVLLVLAGKYTDLSRLVDQEYVRTMVTSYGVYAPLAFILIYILATVFFLPGTIFTVLAGVLFGAGKGTAYVVVGATIGATIAFFISRFFGKSFVDNLLKGKFKKLEQYDEKLEKNGFSTTLFLRLIPLFPFNGLNFALGLTRAKARDYVLGTALGIIPGSFVLASIGASANDFRNPMLYLFIGVFILMGLSPWLYRKWKSRMKG